MKTLVGGVRRGWSAPPRQVITLRLERVRAEADLAGRSRKEPENTSLGGGYELAKVDPEDPRPPGLQPTGILILPKAAQVIVNLRALCGASLVDSSEQKDPDGKPAKVRQCHLSVLLRCHDFVMQKAMEHAGPAAAKPTWLTNRDSLTHNKARTCSPRDSLLERPSSRVWKHVARWNGKPRPRRRGPCLLNW